MKATDQSNPHQMYIFTAALLWSVIGLVLLVRGMTYGLLLPGKMWLSGVAIVLGTAKSFLVLDRVAKQNITRILKMEKGTFILGIYSVKTWCLVLIMILAGILVRSFQLPDDVVGFVFIVIGWGLIMSSRHSWRQLIVLCDSE